MLFVHELAIEIYGNQLLAVDLERPYSRRGHPRTVQTPQPSTRRAKARSPPEKHPRTRLPGTKRESSGDRPCRLSKTLWGVRSGRLRASALRVDVWGVWR